MKGLKLFRDHFAQYADRYVMIGGTACDLAMTQVGREFRATRDLDIVLCMESFDIEFAKAFWIFIKVGKYQQQNISSIGRKFYRFQKPSKPDFPTMLELFSRVPDALPVAEGSKLTPIPVDDGISSLSAIILDDDYYQWIQNGKQIISHIPSVSPEHLIPLKARAWLDLRNRKLSGESIDRKNIKKHKNDIFRLYSIIDPEFSASLPPKIITDMCRFFDEIINEPIDLKQFGLGSTPISTVLNTLRKMYQLK